MYNHKRKRKGQSTIEYLVVLAGVVAVILIFLQPGGLYERRITDTYSAGTDGMVNMANRLRDSRPSQ